MKTAEKKRAIELRNNGYSYNEIRREVSVSKSTLSLWLKNVVLTNKQQEILQQRLGAQSVNSGKGNRDRWNKLKDEVRRSYDPPLNDPHFMLGLGLYWGEGNKTSPIGMANSDCVLLIKFVEWANKFFADDIDDFSLRIHHYYPDRDEEIKDYWRTKLKIDNCTKSEFAVSVCSKRKRRTLTHGTARVIVRGKNTWKIRQKIEKVMEIIKAPFV